MMLTYIAQAWFNNRHRTLTNRTLTYRHNLCRSAVYTVCLLLLSSCSLIPPAKTTAIKQLIIHNNSFITLVDVDVHNTNDTPLFTSSHIMSPNKKRCHRILARSECALLFDEDNTSNLSNRRSEGSPSNHTRADSNATIKTSADTKSIAPTATHLAAQISWTEAKQRYTRTLRAKWIDDVVDSKQPLTMIVTISSGGDITAEYR